MAVPARTGYGALVVPDDGDERPVVCVDVGSTFTKATAVGPSGVVRATAQHPTTSTRDVLVGVDAAVAALGVGPVADDRILLCSSAGGGLRLAVVGQERAVSVEAGRRVALSAGARVVGVLAGPLDGPAVGALASLHPDVVLLVGGTDGGDPEVLLHNASALGRSPLRAPMVVAGNADVAGPAGDLVRAPGRPVEVTANVIPRIGLLAPGPARGAIRRAFITHVIGGTQLSPGPRFGGLVMCATPDAVLSGVELVAEVLGGTGAPVDVMAVDVGGATTDVYSVLAPDEHAPAHVVGESWHGRTVEGDLGVRWSAPDVVSAARAERMLGPGEEVGLAAAAEARHRDVAMVPGTPAESAVDVRLAALAAVVAARRHGRPGEGRVRDLSRVGLLIGSGGVLRQPDAGAAVLRAVLADRSGGWRLPVHARTLVDRGHLLAPIGLLAMAGQAASAASLARALLRG